jgi:hypothetical protein
MKVFISGLLGPNMKVERAATHLKELQALCAAFKADPYAISEKDDEERRLHIVTITLKKMPPNIPILVGEYAHSLRSALDHLSWQLGLLSGRTPSRSSCFPIHSGDSTKDRERLMRVTYDIPCDAVAIIKTLQPHLRGKSMKNDPLWRLNKLSNLDKHVTIGYSHTSVLFRYITWDVPEPPFIPDEESTSVHCLIPLVHKGKVKVEPLTPELIFGKPIDSPRPDFTLTEEDIAEIHSVVRDNILPQFAKFF